MVVVQSRWPLEYPKVSLPTYIFESPKAKLSTSPLYIDADNTSNFLSHAGYRLMCQRLAVGLQKMGLKDMDRLLLFSGNNIYFPCIIWGTVMAGGIFTGANPGYNTRELAYQLENAEAKFLLCSLASLETGLEAAAEARIPKENVFFFNNSPRPEGPQKGCRHWSALLASEDEARDFQWAECKSEADMDRTVVLNYSSGTTGKAKGVEITHRNYVSNISMSEWLAARKDSVYDPLPPTVNLCFLPMYHALAQSQFGVLAPRRGHPTYIMQKFDFVGMMDAIHKFGVTHMAFVPPIVIAFAKHPDVRAGKWNISSIRDVVCGAAPLGRPEAELFESLFKDMKKPIPINVKQGWGMTELTCTGTLSDPLIFSSTNNVGEVIPGSEVRIVKEDGSGDSARNERGEIWVRGPNVMKGYWRNPQATAETKTADGWLKSGDVAYIDENNILYIVDRIKELIKVKGNQVAPAELESVLQSNPSVNDAAVIGVPYQGDEAPRAYIVKTPGTNPTEKEIQQWMETKVSKTKRLLGGVKFVDVIPKNPSGKILRRQLRDLAAKEASQQAKL